MFEKLDKIIATEKDVIKIYEWNKQHKDSIDFVGFPLNEGLFIVEQELNEYKGIKINEKLRQGTYFKIDENGLKIKLYDMKDLKEILSFEVDVVKSEVQYKNIESYLINRISKKEITHTMEATLSTLFEVFAYMMNVESEVIEITESRNVVKKSSNKKKKSKNKVVKVVSKKYIFSKENENQQEHEKRDYNRHSESWSVRGHWRFYKKTGKRVWVSPHVKGNSENVEGKTYKI